MIKIKTITCHDVYNFGASLQAYALMKYLQNLGHDVEIINYKPEYASFNLWQIGPRWDKNFFFRLLFYSYVVPKRLLLQKRRKIFDIFTTNYLRLTSEKYHSYEELKANPPVADIFFAGSDQIWNSFHKHGQDPAYYLDFAPAESLRASYAASFAVSKIPEEYINFVRSMLARFDAISVRENSGLEILNSININNGVVVLDPVFLLTIDEWDTISTFKPSENYILVYDQENNSLIKEVSKRLAFTTGLKIYAIQSLYPMSYAHKRISDLGPLEFLGLIKNCDILLTNSFHGTAFSIIFHKEFYTFRREHEEVNSRMIDLLEMLKISDRIIDCLSDIEKAKGIDFNNIDFIIKNKLEFSKTYIENVIKIKQLNE